MDTKYSVVCFLLGESCREIWAALLKICANAYIGYPDLIAVEQSPQFTSDQWATILVTHGITMRHSGVESYIALVVGKRYYSYLCQVYRRAWLYTPEAKQNLAQSV